jgi:predicted nucleic acid-binding protein
MPFVIDASVTACWLLPDETHPVANLARNLLVNEPAVAPSIWWYEVRNLLIVNERRGRMDAAKSNRALGILRRLPIEIDHQAVDVDVLDLARTHRLTIYDAAYLEVSRRRSLPLASLDGDLIAAARAENLGLLGQN